MKSVHRHSYVRDPHGIAVAVAKLRALVEHQKTHPPSAEDLAWQDDLPELPDDEDPDAVHVEFLGRNNG